MTQKTLGDYKDSGVECPTCGDEFGERANMRRHHAHAHNESLAGFEHECGRCGETFNSKASERNYCSPDCRANAVGEMNTGESSPCWAGREKRVCNYCGKEEYVTPSKSGRPYCSSECAGKDRMSDPTENPFYEGGKKEEVTCLECGTVFEAFECEERQFCGEACQNTWQIGRRTGEDNPQWNGGHYKYGPGWNFRKKEKVRDRDGRECQHCGISEEEHLEKYGCKNEVHHIIKAREFSDPEKRNDMGNLITLCKGQCHDLWDAMSPLRPV